MPFRLPAARLLAIALMFIGLASPTWAADILVRDQRAFKIAMAEADPGDTIILANGEWRNFKMQVRGTGRSGNPITVRAQQPGRVILTGQSYLRLSGRHIVVSGLVFRNGYSPSNEVISFRTSKGEFAYDSRVTQTVIDRYNKPRKDQKDFWAVLYGRGNRFDHNHMVGKTNIGSTVAVRLDDPQSHRNGHRIDHNYFGPRPPLGQNGGESLRIGNGPDAHFDSNTVVERNMFDRADGELEIVSVKSGGNILRDNLFLQSRGTLTLRHGDGNLVERNVFLGRGVEDTGGIRILNSDQVVRGNYMEGLGGTGYHSAITLMNGIPSRSDHSHHQVRRARIANNSVLRSRQISLGAGADAQRTAPPVGSVMRDNLFDDESGRLFDVDTDIGGIATEGNVSIGRGKPLRRSKQVRDGGLVRAANGLLYPSDPAMRAIGAPRDLNPVRPAEVGVTWYPKPPR